MSLTRVRGSSLAHWNACQFRTCPTDTYQDGILCKTISECNFETSFESKKPTATSDRECTLLDNCNFASQYEDVPPTTTSQRVCSNLEICNSSTHFERTTPTHTSNRVCEGNWTFSDRIWRIKNGTRSRNCTHMLGSSWHHSKDLSLILLLI